MKKMPLLIGLLLLALAIALMVYSAGAQGSLHDLLVRMDKDNLADSDSKMQKARDRVTEALLENDRVKALRRSRLSDIEGLALRNAVNHVKQNDVAQLFLGAQKGES